MALPAPNASASATVGVSLIPVLRDNYVFVLHEANGGRAAVVDPAVGEPVIAWLDARALSLVAILHTHHHSDHIGGAAALLDRWPGASVIACGADRERIPLLSQPVAEGDSLSVLGRTLRVLEVPAHTRHHIAFHLLPEAGEGAGDLFCGDTLFAGGCGRLFEGSAAQMHAALQRLVALPDATRVWCAHEYTATNLAWAHSVMPEDRAITARLEEVRARRARGLPTIPSRIGLEKATNLFVRASDATALAELRASRNAWTG